MSELSEQTLATIKLAQTIEELVSLVYKNGAMNCTREMATEMTTAMIQKLVDSFTNPA